MRVYFLLSLVFNSLLITHGDQIKKCNFITDLSNYVDNRIEKEIVKYTPYDVYSLNNNTIEYPQNSTTCWHIVKVDPNYGIKLLFDEFDLQDAECGLNSDECCDYLTIGFGSVVGENVVKKLCGRSRFFEPMYFQSSQIWLSFVSDNTKSFNATITPFQLIYKNLMGKIKCPDYDKSVQIYPNKIDVTFKIDLPEKYLIVLNFNSINLEKFNDTCYDYVQIIEPSNKDTGNSSTELEYQKLSDTVICGNNEPRDYISLSNQLQLRFHSDETATGNLFDIGYKTIQRIFTEPDYTIFSPTYPASSRLNITYTIRAPKDHKIDLRIIEFDFTPCNAEDFDELATEPHKSCQKLDDYLMLTNGRGDLNEKYFEEINKTIVDSWIFCDCNIPLKRYMSFGNELNIKLMTRKFSEKTKNVFRIAYKFVPNLQSSMKKLIVIQDSSLSYIGGYLLSLKVPNAHNLRLYGESMKCILPSTTILQVQSNNTNAYIKYLSNTTNSVNKKPYCNYLFDINEPNGMSNDDGWYVSWFFRISHGLEVVNFEINWMNLKNEVVNKEKGVYTFPAQIGYNLSEEVRMKFAIQTTRKYFLQFLSSIEGIETNNRTEISKYIDGVNSYVRLRKVNKDFDDVINMGYLENPENVKSIDSDEAILKIKRSNLWSVNVSYTLDKYHGDCNFDESLCGYRKDDDEYFNLEHQAKHEWKSNIYEQTDFCLAITKPKGSNAERAAVYTPQIIERNFTRLKELRREFYNKKIFSLAFSFKPNKSTDRLEVFLQTNRSEMYLNKHTDEIQLVQRVNINDGELIVEQPNDCEHEDFNDTWFRVKNILLYSCYDFRLGFAAVYDTNDEDYINTVSTILIDDVNIDSDMNVESCDDENMCGSHGSCVKFLNKSICCCDVGYEGTQCEDKIQVCPTKARTEEINEMDQAISSLKFNNKKINDELCFNNGICIDSIDSYNYSCKCSLGYMGSNCEIEIDECESKPCLNGGKCFDKIGYYRCACNQGYSGINCEIEEDGCQKCHNSSCISIGQNRVKCLCPPGRTGDDCTLDIDECLSNPCNLNVNGTCINLENTFMCTCPTGFTGKVCEIAIDYCKENPKDFCKNNGICVTENGTVACKCFRAHTGKFCEIEVNECLKYSNPCNGGNCIDKLFDFECDCPKGRTGRFCETILENPCLGNKCLFGKCVPIYNNSYECSCNPFYQGEFCDQIKKCNIEEYKKECNPIGTLKVVGYGPTCLCKCKIGFHGEKCEFKEDLCKLRSYECLNGGTCTHTGDKIRCDCRHGFRGDMCEIAENACKIEPCTHGRCENYGSHYQCHCDRGWTGINCDQLEKVCNITADCNESNTLEVSNYDTTKCLCRCKEGFKGDKCEININDCEPSKVNCNNGTCVDLISTYRCDCNQGFTGSFCETKIEGCAARPCYNGKCIQSFIGFTCECFKGYKGLLCEEKVNSCEFNPCSNGGTCHDYIDGYVCECPLEYGRSKHCTEMKRNPCLKDPCFNNATCMPISTVDRNDKNSITYTGFTCICDSAHTGSKCETLKTPCLSTPCQNFGTCLTSRDNRDYHCKCFPLFTGKNCESTFNPCEPNPCLNRGACYQTPYGFKCQCTHEHEGTRCEKKVNLCNKFVCLNGGTCLVEDSLPFCRCPNSRYIGTRCEIDLSLRVNLTQNEVLSGLLMSEADCGLFGNEATILTYVLAAFIILFIFLFIFAIIYFYVHFSIKRIKSYENKVLLERRLLSEMKIHPARRQITFQK